MKKPSKKYTDIISRLRLSPGTAKWVEKDKGINPRGYRNIPSRATEFYEWYARWRRGFLINLAQNHFDELKKIMRMVGRARKGKF